MILLMMGCSNNGMFIGVNQTSVELGKANYKLVATNLVGQSKVGYLFGLSTSFGASTQTFAMFRVDGTGMLYKEALEDLWTNFAAQHGKIEGRKLALANVRYDSEILNLFVYTGVKVFIRADIVEFLE
ncbi:MAG: hypothetical protein JSW33_00600 [bacterium]|nr:MAG: hypothetical protein JSW33_00600 [bacterium]